MTCRFDSADGTPTGNNYWNDMRVRWTSDSAMVGTGTYTIYYNLNCNPFPGGFGWTQLASGITPVLFPPLQWGNQGVSGGMKDEG